VIVPLPLGALKATLTVVALVTDAVPIVGVPDTVVTVDDAFDDTEVPPELVAVAVNVYIVFGVNPDTVIGEDVPVPVKPPGLLVTV
jgi:sulfur carrier protein ThiS